ncbi:dihydroneopterin aldolase [Evansella cellulosilytica]|uniref:7,8-dihydroneopterin aldolase n=1 Tax=Evansella cellulosilytica (strain ATCC 21833 / DSM 2522 / FERM P-1141 / JCM 9156 / N-4) TaxID=649639 RepID=E6TSF4_EVAC2|nr:dihydroneopterin aldolase [Evansella cellulosilytica]ADU28369.1 dihydroneopterin aldolase [Evansella cellulosilytica DSM 2522]
MDKIYVNGMDFYGYHGVFAEENKLGQRFFVDVVMEVNTREAGITDDLNKTVNYGEVYKITKNIMEGQAVNLVESLAERISHAVLLSFPMVHAVVVKVVKPNPPIQGHYESVAVEIRRER